MTLEQSKQQKSQEKPLGRELKPQGLEGAKPLAASPEVEKERARVAPQSDNRMRTLVSTATARERREQGTPQTTSDRIKVTEANKLVDRYRSGNYSSRYVRGFGLRGQQSRENSRSHQHGQKHDATNAQQAELRELMSIRANNALLSNKMALQSATIRQRRQQADPRTDLENDPKQALPGTEKEALERKKHDDPTIGADGSANEIEAAAAQSRFSDRTVEVAHANEPGLETDAAQAVATAPEEHVKLVDLVGPEAVLSFKEKLREVWVVLDEQATQELDVLARMPANLMGLSAVELLMVESPQGIHFVSFLRNRNDFEILATFDRHDLLPSNPTRQLLEAAVVAYEQLDTIFKEGSQHLGERVKQLAVQASGDDPVLQMLRMRWAFAKRRRARFERMIDYLLGELDEVELRAQQDQQGLSDEEAAEMVKLEMKMQESEEEMEEGEPSIVKIADYLKDSHSRLRKAS